MKKIILAISAVAAAGFATQASAVDACTNSTAASSVSISAQNPASFIKQGFTNKCSANVFLQYEESANAVAVCSGSSKGNYRFSGTSDTGAVIATGTKGNPATTTNTAATIAANGCSAP